MFLVFKGVFIPDCGDRNFVLYPTQVIGNGTYALIDTGVKRLLVKTAPLACWYAGLPGGDVRLDERKCKAISAPELPIADEATRRQEEKSYGATIFATMFLGAIAEKCFTLCVKIFSASDLSAHFNSTASYTVPP